MDCVREREWNARHSQNLFFQYGPSIVDLPEDVPVQPVASEVIHITCPQAVVQPVLQPHAEPALVVWCVLQMVVTASASR
jgi:hypothetical protein